jgi:hypothetical protein
MERGWISVLSFAVRVWKILTAPDNPVNTASSTSTFAGTSTTVASKPVEFLPLDPTLGKPSSTEAATETKTGGAYETGMPIIPLNPDVATMGTGPTTTSTSHTGITDNSGAAGKTYKDDSSAERLAGLSLSETPTTGAYQDASALDKETTKPAPSKEAAAHQESSTPNKESSGHQKAGSSAPEGKHSVSNAIDAILHPTPASEHSVPDELADAEHSKMIGHHPSKPVSDEHQRKDD